MGLTNRKEEQLKNQPVIKTRMWRSENKGHFVFQTTITDIKPVAYIEKVLESDREEGMVVFE